MTMHMPDMKVFVCCSLMAIASVAWGNGPDSTSLELSLPDEEVNRMDSLIESWFSDNPAIRFAEEEYRSLGFAATDTPRYNPDEITRRLDAIETPIPLTYNSTVQSFIDLYTERRRSKVSEMLTLGQFYFPMIEEELDRRGLPMELKYVAVIESALNTHAVSKAGATGLWQLMYGTGKLLGLRIDSYVDERRDPYLATEAGIEYLSRMYDIYGDWLLSIAAYNCGPGNVNKALRKAGGGNKTFWDIWAYLPRETRSYVPIFIAATYTFEYHREHNILPAEFTYHYDMVDTVMVTRKMTLDQIGPYVGMTVDELKYYNPCLKTNTVPGGNTPYSLRLPNEAVAMWITNEEQLYASLETPVKQETATVSRSEKEPVAAVTTAVAEKKEVASTVTVSYVVKKNDNLGYISQWFNCSVSDLKKWNHLSSTKIMPGQKLKIVVPADQQEHYASVTHMSFSDKQKLSDMQMVQSGEQKKESEVVYYTIKPGDSLWSISKKYPENTIATLQEMNQIGQNETLKVGSKIKIVK